MSAVGLRTSSRVWRISTFPPNSSLPQMGFTMAGDGAGRTWRIGARWAAEPAFALALEARHGRADGDTGPTAATVLRASLRW